MSQVETTVELNRARLQLRHSWRWQYPVFAVAVLFPIAIYGYCLNAGLVPEIQARLLGEDLAVDSTTESLGNIVAGERRIVQFGIKNLTEVQITLLGAHTSCSCTVVDDLPLTIAPGKAATISMSYTASEKSIGKAVQQSAIVYYDGAMPGKSIRLTVTGVVIGPRGS